MAESLWKRWKRFARKIGDFQARLLMELFYFVVLMPFALALKIFGKSTTSNPGSSPQWHPRTKDRDSLEAAFRQS